VRNKIIIQNYSFIITFIAQPYNWVQFKIPLRCVRQQSETYYLPHVDYEEKLKSVNTIYPLSAGCYVFSGFRYKTHSTVTPFFKKSAVL